MFENKSKTTLESLGEFGLINHLAANFKETIQSTTLKAIGDDAAVININAKEAFVISTDMLVEGVHFDFMYSPLKHLGYKAITTNLSDIAAMNATPTQVLVSIAMSSKMTLEAVEELYIGIKSACDTYKVDLIGGDTANSRKGVCISVTAIGKALKKDILYRNGVKPTNLVCVTGDLGAAYTGYMLLEREKRIFLENPAVQPDMEGKDYILQRQLKPEARTDIKQLLADLKITPTAMIDISDGLSSELFHLAEQSNVGFVIYEDKIPIDPVTYNVGRELGLDPTTTALNGGEDYELLFTIPATDFDKIKNSLDFSVIGYATEPHEKLNLVSKSGNNYPLEAQGWQSFKQ